MRIAFPAKESTETHRAHRSSWWTSVAGVNRVAGGVVGDQRFAFSFRGLAPLFLVISLAQQLLFSWSESPGMGTAFVGSPGGIRWIGSPWFRRWREMKRRLGHRGPSL